jgi:hypothetical protein
MGQLGDGKLLRHQRQNRKKNSDQNTHTLVISALWRDGRERINPKRHSFVAKRDHWIHSGSTPRRKIAGKECDRGEDRGDGDKRQWIRRGDAK